MQKIGGPGDVLGLVAPNPLGYMLVRHTLSWIMMLARNVLLVDLLKADDSFQDWIRTVRKDHKKAGGPSFFCRCCHVTLSICLYVCLCVSLLVCLSVCLPMCPSSDFACLPACLSAGVLSLFSCVLMHNQATT